MLFDLQTQSTKRRFMNGRNASLSGRLHAITPCARERTLFPKRQLMFLYIKLSLYSAAKAHSYVIDMVIIQIEHFFSLLITFQTLVYSGVLSVRAFPLFELNLYTTKSSLLLHFNKTGGGESLLLSKTVRSWWRGWFINRRTKPAVESHA